MHVYACKIYILLLSGTTTELLTALLEYYICLISNKIVVVQPDEGSGVDTWPLVIEIANINMASLYLHNAMLYSPWPVKQKSLPMLQKIIIHHINDVNCVS